jgi:hypothetical protein
MKIKKETTTTIRGRLEIPREVLIKALREHVDSMIPEDAMAYVQVPGGGDWSNTDLQIDGDLPLIVEFTQIHTR